MSSITVYNNRLWSINESTYNIEREERLQNLQGEIEKNGGTAICKVTNVTSHVQMEELAAYTLEKFGQIDVNIKALIFRKKRDAKNASRFFN